MQPKLLSSVAGGIVAAIDAAASVTAEACKVPLAQQAVKGGGSHAHKGIVQMVHRIFTGSYPMELVQSLMRRRNSNG